MLFSAIQLRLYKSKICRVRWQIVHKYKTMFFLRPRKITEHVKKEQGISLPVGCVPFATVAAGKERCLPWWVSATLPSPVHAGIHPPAHCMLGYTSPTQCSASWDTPPWTHACENITFPQLLLRTVMICFYHTTRLT